jgi:hypothetical protein
MTKTPAILFLIYRRADTTARVFQAIREARPARLFVAADGPRQENEGEAEECEKCRRVIDQGVDWPCQVEKLYRKENLGLKNAIGQSISWFFEQVEEGIILEDDTLPSADFFRYCANLLECYRDDSRIWVIGGSNFIGSRLFAGDSYAFTLYNPMWGWASWKRAWKFYEPTPADINAAADPVRLERLLGSEEYANFWSDIFHRVARGQINSYAYLWRLALWKHEALSVIPSVNLISNIGFDHRATHTTSADNPKVNRTLEVLSFPLIHPKEVVDNREITLRKLKDKMSQSGEASPTSLFSRWAGYFRSRLVKKKSVL